MNGRSIRLSLATIECFHLSGLIDEFTSVLAMSADTSDAGIDRLTPDVYPEDAAASAEFRSATRDDLIDRRVEDAVRVQLALAPFVAVDAETLTEEQALTPRDISIPPEDLDAWLRTLTAIRLVIASRLDITTDDEQRDPDDPRFGVYDWLAYRLDTLLTLADEVDETTF